MAREQFQTLTEPMYYILLALTEECCGVDIMEKVRQISDGRVKVKDRGRRQAEILYHNRHRKANVKGRV